MIRAVRVLVGCGSRLRDHFHYADISVLILGEADKPQNRRQFRINYELILS
jgi:hypothetical protein